MDVESSCQKTVAVKMTHNCEGYDTYAYVVKQNVA